MRNDVTVSLILDSLTVFPKDYSTTIFQMRLLIHNPGPNDIVPFRTEIDGSSPFNWFSKSLHNFKIICDAGFCILRENTLQDTFYFSMHQSLIDDEQKAFYEIINETKELKEAIKFETIRFQLSDGTSFGAPINSILLNS